MKFFNYPTTLTWMRIFILPVFVVCFFLPFESTKWISCGLFALAAVTDYLDGFLARYLKQTTAFGAFLDPVADKLIVATALVLLVSYYPSPWMAIAGVVIVCREIIISALREWMAELGKHATTKVSMIGKLKTCFQLVAIIILLTHPLKHTLVYNIGFGMLYFAVLLTLYSMFNYLHVAYRALETIESP